MKEREHRAIFLNTWNGIMFEELMGFIDREKEDTDVFCFQEILDTPTSLTETNGSRANLYQELKDRLQGFNGFLAPMFYGYDLKGQVDFPLRFGNATFWRKELSLDDISVRYIHRKDPTDVIVRPDFIEFSRNVLLTRFQLNDRPVTIGNFHGIWMPGGKSDNSDRLNQADKLANLRETIEGEYILGGDFNLGIANPSLEIIEGEMRNLIKEHNIHSTRSSFYGWEGLHADYVLISRGVQMKGFRVMSDEVSDHLPLELLFS